MVSGVRLSWPAMRKLDAASAETDAMAMDHRALHDVLGLLDGA
jgi:hypothetical protein